MAQTFAGKILYGGGDIVVGLVFVANAASIGSLASPIGMFLLVRGALTVIGISL